MRACTRRKRERELCQDVTPSQRLSLVRARNSLALQRNHASSLNAKRVTCRRESFCKNDKKFRSRYIARLTGSPRQLHPPRVSYCPCRALADRPHLAVSGIRLRRKIACGRAHGETNNNGSANTQLPRRHEPRYHITTCPRTKSRFRLAAAAARKNDRPRETNSDTSVNRLGRRGRSF